MCGILGLLGEDVTPEALSGLNDLLTHRGPDDAGMYLGDGIALAARRLSIVDVAGGHQPLSNEDGAVWLTYNGEIVNAPALRAELRAAGHRFRTETDTEVIVHAYEAWGVEAVTRLRGMYAFGLWDAPRRRLVLARDRFGIKPLYYAEAAGRWGSPRKQVRKVQEAIDTVRPALFEIRDPPDGDTIFAELVAGGSYTFADGTNVSGEYYFIQDGYSDRQWGRVLELIEVSRSQFLEGVFRDRARRDLLRANELLTFRRLRRHYVFVRIHNARWFGYFDAALSVLLNAEDRSVAVAPIIDFIGSQNLRLGINVTILEGPRDSEFGLAPYEARLSVLLRYFF